MFIRAKYQEKKFVRQIHETIGQLGEANDEALKLGICQALYSAVSKRDVLLCSRILIESPIPCKELLNCYARFGENQETLLMIAVNQLDYKMVECLFLHGADVNLVDVQNWTALHHAVSGDDLKMVSQLLLRCPDAELRDNQDRRPLELATCSSSKELEELLYTYMEEQVIKRMHSLPKPFDPIPVDDSVSWEQKSHSSTSLYQLQQELEDIPRYSLDSFLQRKDVDTTNVNSQKLDLFLNPDTREDLYNFESNSASDIHENEREFISRPSSAPPEDTREKRRSSLSLPFKR